MSNFVKKHIEPFEMHLKPIQIHLKHLEKHIKDLKMHLDHPERHIVSATPRTSPATTRQLFGSVVTAPICMG